MNAFRSSKTEVKQQSKYKNNLYGNSISLMYKVHFQKNNKRRNTLSAPNPQANRVTTGGFSAEKPRERHGKTPEETLFNYCSHLFLFFRLKDRTLYLIENLDSIFPLLRKLSISVQM